MHRIAGVAIVFITTSLSAAAQEAWDVWEAKWTGEAALVFAPGAEGEDVLYRLGIGFDANRVLDNGLVLGIASQLDAELANGRRAGFSGIVADPATGVPSFSGSFSGLARSSASENQGARGVLQKAYVYAEGGYGEVRLGRDDGVAKRFAQGAPSLFSTLSLHAPRIDPEGGVIVRTDHDLTGPATKLSYATPRIVGLRGGLSITPEADVRGLDRDPVRILPGTAAVSIRNAAEASLSFSHRFRKSGVRLRASTAFSRADTQAAPSAPVRYGKVDTWSIGANAEWQNTMIGAALLGSNNGLDGLPGDYSAWTIGLVHKAVGFSWGAEYGEAGDEAAGVDGESWRAGLARQVTDNASLALGYRKDTLSRNTMTAVPRNLGGEGIVFEITLSR